MTVTSSHAEAVRDAMSQFKKFATNLEAVLPGHEFNAHQIASIASAPGARNIWDEKFDSEVKQVYNAGIAVTYITQVDLAGSIPTAFVKSVQEQVPLCAGLVVQYAKDYGYPPTITEGSEEFKSENFGHATREYVTNLDGTGDSMWLISKKMYPNGVKVAITENGNGIVEVTGINGPTIVKNTKASKPKNCIIS